MPGCPGPRPAAQVPYILGNPRTRRMVRGRPPAGEESTFSVLQHIAERRKGIYIPLYEVLPGGKTRILECKKEEPKSEHAVKKELLPPPNQINKIREK